MVRPSMNTSPLSKKNFIKTKGLGNDRLSSLPGHLLSRILSELPTKDSVSTSVLSKRWRNIWLDVPVLDLNVNDFEDEFNLMNFIDSFLDVSCGLDRFELLYDVTYVHHHDVFVLTIDDVIRHKVRHLSVVNLVDFDRDFVRMPLSLYSCATLVDLTLFCVVLDDPQSELVSLPCVKKMCLEGVKFDGDNIMHTFIAKCPILEDLTIITHPDDDLKVVCVCSKSLKIFKLESRRPEGEDPNVEIYGPKLELIMICAYQPRFFLIRSIGPFAKVHADIVFDVDYDDDSVEMLMRWIFLTGLSRVYEMTISALTVEVIHGYSMVETLPKVSKLSRLNASLVESSWEYLPAFLGCCTNLRSLIVEIDYLPSIEEIELSPVPQCVLSSLEFVQLKTPETPETPRITELGTYFMKKCALFQNCTFEVSGNTIKIIKKDSKEI